MKKTLKMLNYFLKRLFVKIKKQKLKAKNKKQFSEWKKNGCPVPPPHIVKQLTIKEYQAKYSISTFIETGTYLGDMVEAQKKRFKKIISIELGIDLYTSAKKRFKNYDNIVILQGDSGKVLHTVLKDINEQAILWLDGHYSGGITVKGVKECPIFEELDAVFNDNNFNHIILIDDARCFIGKGDYPTIDGIKEYIKDKNSEYQVNVKDDIIRFEISPLTC